MSGNPDDSNYIHEQPTDTVNDSSSAALSSSTSDDEDVEGRLSSDSKIFERIKELGRTHGPLKPIRQSYRPSITSRRTSSVGTGVSDDTNGDEDEDQAAGKRESSGYIDLKALRRVLGNRLEERPLEELARSEEGSSVSSQLATGSITGAGSELPSAASVSEEDELQERTEAQKEEEGVADEVSDETSFDGDQAAIGGSQDNEELSSRSQIFETQGSVLIADAQTTLEAPNSERKAIDTMQVSDTHGSISLVSSKPKRRGGGSEKVSTLSSSGSGGSNASGTSRMIMLPPSAVPPMKSRKDSYSRSKESVSSRNLFKESDIAAETATNSRGTSKGHSARMITSTPAAESESHLSVSQQLGISAISRNHSSVSSIPSYVARDTSSKEITTDPFSESDRTRSRSSVKKRLTFEGEKEGSREETKESSLTMTLDIDDIPGLEDEGNHSGCSTPTGPQVGVAKVREVANSAESANDRTPGGDSINEAVAADELQGISQNREISTREANLVEEAGSRLSRLSGNMAEDEEIIPDNVLPPAAAFASDENDANEAVAQSLVSRTSDEQVSISSSITEEIFMRKCEAAMEYANKNNLVVGNITAKESMMGENIPPVRMLKMGSSNMFPQVMLGASERTAAEEAKARKDAADRNGSSRDRGEDSSNSATSDSRFDPSKRFKRPRKLTVGSSLKKHPSEIYGSVLSYVHKTSMSSSQGSRMGHSSQSQRDSTQLKDILPSIEEPGDELDIGTQSQSSQPTDRAILLPDIFPELLPVGRNASPAASQVLGRSAIRSRGISMEHVSKSSSKQAEQLAVPETSQSVKGSMESLFSEGRNARTPRRSDRQEENMQRLQEPATERRTGSKEGRSSEGSNGQEHFIERRSDLKKIRSIEGSKGQPVNERGGDLQESRSNEGSEGQEPAIERRSEAKKRRSTEGSNAKEHLVEGKSDAKKSRSTEGSKGQEQSTTDNISSTNRFSNYEKSSAIPVLKSHRGSNITRDSADTGTNGHRTAEGLEQEAVRSLTPHRNSATHNHFLLETSPSLSRRSVHPAPPEYSSDDESSFVAGKAEETRTKSVVDKHPLKQRRQSRMPVADSSSSEAELEQHQRGRRSVDERRKRQSVRHSEASVTRAPSSFRGAGGGDATLERTRGTASLSPRDKFEDTHGESRSELNVESRTHARGTPEASDVEGDPSEPLPHSNTSIMPNIIESNAKSLSSRASQVEPSSSQSDAEISDATVKMSSFLEARKRNKLLNNSSSTGRRGLVKATVTHVGEEEAMEVDMLSPTNEVEEADRVVVHMNEQEEEERIEIETQSGSYKPQMTVSGRKSKKSAASVKEVLSVKQTNTRSSHLSPVQESLREPVSPCPASTYGMRSRNKTSRPSHSLGSVRGDAIEGIAEAPDADQMDVDELPAEPVLSQTLKGRLDSHGLSLSNGRERDTERLEKDGEQDRGVPSAKTFTKSGTSVSTRSVNSKSKSQILEEDFDEVVNEILDEQEDIVNDEHFRQVGRTFVTSQREDSVGRRGNLENPATALTGGQRGGHGSAAVRSLRSSTRKSSVESLVAPLTDHPAIQEGEDTITEVRRKRKGEDKDAPLRMEQQDIENDEREGIENDEREGIENDEREDIENDEREDIENDEREDTENDEREDIENDDREDIENDEQEDIENEEPVRQIERTLVTSPREDSVGRSGHLKNAATSLTREQREGHDRETAKSLRSSTRKSSVASAVAPLTERRATPEGRRIEARRKRKGQTIKAPARVSVEETEEPEQPGPSSSRQTGNRRVEQAEIAISKGTKKTKRPAATPTRPAPKKPKRNDLEALMRNDNLISTQLVRWKCEANNIRLNNDELAEMTAFLNEEFEKMLNSLQRSTLREHGMFSFRELESALRSRGLIHGVKNELHCWFAQLLTPEDYKKAQGVLIPKGRDRDT